MMGAFAPFSYQVQNRPPLGNQLLLLVCQIGQKLPFGLLGGMSNPKIVPVTYAVF
jgi:hypothetical protein